MILHSVHNDNATLSSARGMYYVKYDDLGRPEELLQVSWQPFVDTFKFRMCGYLGHRLNHAAVFPSSSDLLSRELTLRALCTTTLNFMDELNRTHPEQYSIDPTGTILFARLVVELDDMISCPPHFAPATATCHNLTRLHEIVDLLVCMLHTLTEMWTQRGIQEWVSPNIKDLSATGPSAPTIHAVVNVAHAHTAVMHQCQCRHETYTGRVPYGKSRESGVSLALQWQTVTVRGVTVQAT
jgi:hypothetical protein